MERKLTDEEISNICMFMRVSELLKNNQHIMVDHPEFKQAYDMLKIKMDQILEMLTQEEIDEILEEHKAQLEILAEEEDKKNAKQMKRKP